MIDPERAGVSSSDGSTAAALRPLADIRACGYLGANSGPETYQPGFPLTVFLVQAIAGLKSRDHNQNDRTDHNGD